jgi:hypothetical protein
MPINVISSPPLVALNGNPVRFQLQSDNFLEQVGSRISFAILFANYGSGFEDDWIEFRWNAQIVRLVCKPNPDDSGTQIFDNSGNISTEDWIEKFFKSLSLNYYLSNDFTFTREGLSVVLQAKEMGDQYAIEWSCSWTSELKPWAGMSGSNQITRPFYKLGMQVMLASGDSWVKIGEDIHPVNDLGITTFDIHRLFDDHVYPLFQFPEPTSPLMLARPDACREYRVRYFEQYGGDLMARALTESDSFFILYAGISALQEALYNRGNTSFWAKLQYNNYFLTWQPLEKLVTRNQTEKLFFLLQEPTASLILRISFRFKNGTGSSSYPMFSIDAPTVKTVYELTCTPSVMEVPGWETDQLDYYQVWLENDQMDRISEIRTFRFDYQYHESERLFLFLNSLGGYDTIRFTGDQEDFLEYDRVLYNSVLPSDFTAKDHHLAQLTATETRKFKANTGWVTPEATAWIRDFFLSKNVYRLTGGKLIPVIITTTQATHRKDKEDLFSIDFEYTQSFSNENYSREIVAANLNNDFNGDFVNQ